MQVAIDWFAYDEQRWVPGRGAHAYVLSPVPFRSPHGSILSHINFLSIPIAPYALHVRFREEDLSNLSLIGVF